MENIQYAQSLKTKMAILSLMILNTFGIMEDANTVVQVRGLMTEAMNGNHTLTNLSTQINQRRCSK